MSYDPAVVREWLYATLHGNAPLLALAPGSIWNSKAPPGTQYPFVTFHMQAAAPDTTSVSRRRVISNALWMVRATGVMGDSDSNLDTIASEVDGLLDRAGGTAGTGRVYMATREVPWERTYDEDGKSYREAGGLYRIWVRDPA